MKRRNKKKLELINTLISEKKIFFYQQQKINLRTNTEINNGEITTTKTRKRGKKMRKVIYFPTKPSGMNQRQGAQENPEFLL